MGVPGLWRWLQHQFPSAFRTATRFEPRPHTLLVDLNGVIHESMKRSGSSAAVLSAVGAAVEMARPRHTVYLAIDGVAPRTKAREQRARRLQNAPAGGGSGAAFSPLLVTPGTEWMRVLEQQLCAFIGQQRAQWGGVRVVLSGRADPGEGEHKIAEYLRCARDPCLVWSGDADAVLLALAGRAPATVVRGHPTGPSHTAVDVDLLRSLLCARYGSQPPSPRTADDLVFVALLAGGDVLPPLVASSDCPVADLWAVYQATVRAGEHLHERGTINVPVLQRLLAAVVREHEDRAFRRYIGATALGTQLAALRARRLAWDSGPTVAAMPARGTKHGRKGKKAGGSHGRRRTQRSVPGAPPLVWTGSIAEIGAAADTAWLQDAQPITTAPSYQAAGSPPLTIGDRPLLSLAMAPAAGWIWNTATHGSSNSSAVAGAGQLSADKIAWLCAYASALGLHLECYAASDGGFAEQHARWREMRASADPSAAILAPDVQLVLVASKQSELDASGQPAPVAAPRLVSVVDDREWDVLLGDAKVERQCAEARADWSAAFYWHGQLPADVVRSQLCAWYARALGWAATCYFTGHVASWTLAADFATAPLPSDLLAYIQGAEQCRVPDSPTPPPRLSEHLLSVLPPAAWPSMLTAEEAALAKQLRESHYSDAAHVHVAQALAAISPAADDEAPMVYIWL